MKVLEAAMIEQKLITSVSIFVRLRSTSILKSMSDFYVTDSYLCLCFKFSNPRSILKLTSNDITNVCPILNPNQEIGHRSENLKGSRYENILKSERDLR
jgi:hypothetical protein